MNDIAKIEPARKGKLINRFAERFGVDENKLLSTLKSTAFKVSGGEPTNEQMMALMVVADQYRLNPFTKEVYAFPDRNGIVPVVGVDGWARIINEHPQFDGMDFQQDAESCTCVIHRKDRAHPIRITEYMSECSRGTGPWQSHPRRMLRHKAMIQCARIAFGFAGIYDQDEAERIVEAKQSEPDVQVTQEREHYTDEQFEDKLAGFERALANGKSPDELIAMIETRYQMSEDQKRRLHDIAVVELNVIEDET